MELITLKNNLMEVTLCDVGASIFRLKFDNRDMLVGPSKIEDFLRKDLYFGKTIGRICGRVKNKQGKIILHGGAKGLSNQRFEYTKEDNCVTFTYLSKGDSSSNDGETLIIVSYTLFDNELRVDLIAEPREEATISLTNHTYFCLGEKNVQSLSLQMDSDKCLTYDKSLFPVGTDSTLEKFNFKEMKPIMTYGDVDTYFYLNRNPIILKSDNYQLEIETNYEGTVVYTDNFPDDTTTFVSKARKYRGAAIEPQGDSMNRKSLLAGETLARYISYRFTKL